MADLAPKVVGKIEMVLEIKRAATNEVETVKLEGLVHSEPQEAECIDDINDIDEE